MKPPISSAPPEALRQAIRLAFGWLWHARTNTTEATHARQVLSGVMHPTDKRKGIEAARKDGAKPWTEADVLRMDIEVPKQSESDECGASGAAHLYRANGPNGEIQCSYCGDAPPAIERHVNDKEEAARFRKLRGYMSSNVKEGGWQEVERVGAVYAWMGQQEGDTYLDTLPECTVGFSAPNHPIKGSADHVNDSLLYAMSAAPYIDHDNPPSRQYTGRTGYIEKLSPDEKQRRHATMYGHGAGHFLEQYQCRLPQLAPYPIYRSDMGERGDAYIKSVNFRQNDFRLPAMFRWSDLYEAMLNQRPDQIAQAEQDALYAKLYRFLREQTWDKASLCVVVATSGPLSVTRHVSKQIKLGSYCPSGDLLDDAVKAAMLYEQTIIHPTNPTKD